ncbi:serine protease, partial [Streptomyces gulbargensis]
EKQEEPKFGYPDPEDIDENYVPTWEDFRPNEEDKLIREKMNKRTSFIQKVVGFSVAFALLVSLIQIWPALFNMNSISFLQESKELSKQEEIQAYKEAVVLIQDGHSKGTGFVITENGLIVTNRHVVDGMFPITVTFPHGERFIAELIYTDPDVDLAFIKVEGEALPS